MIEQKTIFHVDDEPAMRRLVNLILAKRGYKLESAENGRKALKWLANARPDLVLLDIAMPVMDGWAVLQKMQEYDHLRGVPVVFLTAKLGTADALQGLHDIEADGYLTKPFNPTQLLEKVREIIGEGEGKQ